MGDDRASQQCSCPTGTYCKGSLKYLEEGEWSASLEAYTLFNCENEVSCLGGNDSACAEGYTGPFCGVCAHGYFPSSTRTNVCSKCMPSSGISSFLIIIVPFGLLLLLGIAQWLGLDRAIEFIKKQIEDMSEDLTNMLKLVINFFQVCATSQLACRPFNLPSPQLAHVHKMFLISRMLLL